MKDMTKKSILILVVCAPLLLSACVSNPYHQKYGAGLGGILGGIGGAQIGSGDGRTAAIIFGTLIGATVGGNIGRTMDQVDQMKLAQTLENTSYSQTVSWHNPNSGHRYTVTPQRPRTYQRSASPHCKRIGLKSRIDGRSRQSFVTACRQPNGNWLIRK